jgi:6-pyruvoyltetrahydropterin/6-carboxytetrahydropterin synthase
MSKDTPTKIARQFFWEMGHRLPFHTGGCANIHGHSYQLWVELEGFPDENGMVLDYGDMKRLVRPLIDRLDHAFMCDERDELMTSFLKTTPFKVCYVPFHSTAENIAGYLADELWQLFAVIPAVHALCLRLQETDHSYAETTRRRQ